jgi:hypothetical protein
MAMPSGMNRMGQFPLDMSSVYYDRASLEAYATSGAIAYVGQIVSLVDEANKKVTVYSIQNTEGLLKEVGTVPVGDGASVVVDAEGKVALKGVSELVFERELEDGGKEEVQYQALMTKNGLVWVEPSKTTVEGLATLIEALTVRVKANEDAIKAITDDYLKAEDKYDDTELAGRVAAIEADYLKSEDKYDDADVQARIKAIEDDYLVADDIANMATDSEVEAAVKAEADRAKGAEQGLQDQINLIMNNPDTENVINSISEFVTYINEHGEIAEGFRTDIDANADAIEDLDAAYKAADSTLSGRLDVLEAIDHDAYKTADATLKSELQSEIAEKATKAKDDAIADAATKYATTGALSQLETDLDARLDVLEAYDHATYATKSALEVTDGVAKDAQSRVGIVEGKIDEITSVGGEPNVVEKIKVNGVTLEIEKDAEGKSTKSVNIPVPTKFSDITDDSGFDARITAAKSQADKGVSDAADAAQAASNAQAKADANATAINANSAAITLLQEKDQTHTSQIAALQQHDSDHTALYNTLNSTVSTHGTEIAGLKTGKADTTVTDGLAGRITVNENAIKLLNETTLPAMNEEIGKKANSDNVYSINAADNKFLAKADYTAYDDSGLKKLVSDEAARADAEEKRIVGLITAEAERADAEEKRIVGLVEAEAARADAAEKANANAIAALDATLKAALENDGEGLDSIKELALWVEEHGQDAAEMAEAIGDNADAIKAIYNASGEKATGILVDEITRVEGKADANALAIAAINNNETGILAAAKTYADEKFNAVPVADGNTIVVNDKKLSVAKVSTDILEQGALELILFGGTAAGHIVD